MSQYGPWYKSFWQSRKWVVGTFLFAVPLFLLRWFEHMNDTAFSACYCGLIGFLFAANEYEKRTAVKAGEGLGKVVEQVKQVLAQAKPGEEP